MSSTDNMSPAAIAAWENLTKSYGQPLKINSAYRDPAHNKRAGGAKKSQHMHGNAYDVDVSNLSRDERLKLIEMGRGAGFQGIGVYNNALHFDVGPSRAWGSDYTSKTLPSWAAGAVGAPVGAIQAGQRPDTHEAHNQAPTGQSMRPPMFGEQQQGQQQTPNALYGVGQQPEQQQQQQPFQFQNALRVQDFLLPVQQQQPLRFT